jgi:hypothetical protein
MLVERLQMHWYLSRHHKVQNVSRAIQWVHAVLCLMVNKLDPTPSHSYLVVMLRETLHATREALEVHSKQNVSEKDEGRKGQYKEGLGSFRMRYRMAVFPSLQPTYHGWLANPRLYLKGQRRSDISCLIFNLFSPAFRILFGL